MQDSAAADEISDEECKQLASYILMDKSRGSTKALVRCAGALVTHISG
jgi:hypothetical protein